MDQSLPALWVGRLTRSRITVQIDRCLEILVYPKTFPLSLRERVGVRASQGQNQLRKPATIRPTLTPDPSPAERARGDYKIGS